MKLTHYGKREWLTILAVAAVLAAVFVAIGWYLGVALVAVVALALLSFFRDPHREVPTPRNIMVSPADGKVSSVHELEHYEPLGEAAVCVRIFLSVLDVHVNRSPCHAMVASIHHQPGRHLNAMRGESAKVNESLTMRLVHPTRGHPVAVVRQVAGAVARRIVCAAGPGDILQRGQRYGMIKFGSTTELYLPRSSEPRIRITKGQRVYGGSTILAEVHPRSTAPATLPAMQPGAAPAADASTPAPTAAPAPSTESTPQAPTR